ncbi:unnamed protein product, partial [Vitis vinifera]
MTNVNLRKASNWLQVTNKFHSLSELRLAFCELHSIDPLPHVNFSSLIILDLSYNYFISSSLDWFANLNSLVTLNLASSNIPGPIPSGLRNVTSLRFLDLSYNNFASLIPDWLNHITNFEHLNLASLNIESNNFHGSFLETLGEYKSSEHLDLGKNQLSGHFPSELGQLKNLSYLCIDRNLFSGQIPISLGGLSSLSYLNIRENFFNGIMSEKHLANLTSLEELDASLNLLTLQVSSNWTPPFQLTRLELGSCFLGPQFPAWLQTQKYLRDLNMSYAGISSVIPAWFWTQSYRSVDLSHNQIIGNIPSLHSFDIYLGSNNFTGPLPQISSDNILWSLDLSGNILSGELPDCWASWTLLMVLRSQNNILTGHLPSSMGSLLQLRSLHLHNNSLSGTLPPSMQGCKSLSFVDLSENEFSGSIPLWVGKNLSYGSCPTIK